MSGLSPRWAEGQGCVMSPWLFNYVEGVVREVCYSRKKWSESGGGGWPKMGVVSGCVC